MCQSFAAVHDTSDCRRQVTVDMAEVLDVLREVELVEVGRQRAVASLDESRLDSLATFTLYRGKPYALIVEADWLYIPTLCLNAQTQASATLQGYTLEELKGLSEPLSLPLAAFHSGTAQMLPLAYREMKNLARFMRQHAGCQIELSVHLDGADDKAAYNLSLEQATALRNYLVGCGIDAGRIQLSAYGNVVYKKGGKPLPVSVRFY